MLNVLFAICCICCSSSLRSCGRPRTSHCWRHSLPRRRRRVRQGRRTEKRNRWRKLCRKVLLLLVEERCCWGVTLLLSLQPKTSPWPPPFPALSTSSSVIILRVMSGVGWSNSRRSSTSSNSDTIGCCCWFLLFLLWLLLVLWLWLFLLISRLFSGTHHIAYFLVHSRASSLYFSRSVLYILAISGTRGSSGFGSHSREQIDSNTFDIVNAGDHWDRKMSRQIEPLLFMLGWYMRVVKATLGGLNG